MPSPFPGMDPWLESPTLWSDLHATLLPTVREELVKRLPPQYAALIGQYVWLEGPDEDDRVLLGAPDIHVASPHRPAAGGGAIAVAAPVRTTLPVATRVGHRYLRITDRERRRLVTVVELLSPSNKDAGRDRPHYLRKRNEYFATGVNFLEVDLLRGGERMPLGEPAPPASDYVTLLVRAAEYPRVGLWPFGVRDAVPPLVVPLDPADADVVIDLKGCLDRCYDGARYSSLIDYSRPPAPPLGAADAAWAAELLAGYREDK